MKKTLGSLAAAVLLAASATACSSNSTSTSSSSPSTSTSTSTSSSSPSSGTSTSAGSPSTSTSTSTGSSIANYCTALKESRAEFSNMNLTALTDNRFNQLRDRIRSLQDQAPSAIQADWGVFGDKLDAFQSLLAGAGIKIDDLKSMQKGQLPPGVDAAKLQALGPKLSQLMTGNDLKQAMSAITKNAKSDCHITMH